MVLPQQQRRTQQKTQCTDNRLANNKASYCSKNHNYPSDNRPRHRASPSYCNAMTQTSEPKPGQSKPPPPPLVSDVLVTPSNFNTHALHWSPASGLARHKLPDTNCCLNASEKVQVACQAVEVSAASLHSLVECLRLLPQTADQDTMVAEKDTDRQRLSGGRRSSTNNGGGYVRPLRTSSPMESRQSTSYSSSTTNVSKELALLLEKVRELRSAAADADRELISLRAENAYLRRQQLINGGGGNGSRRSADGCSLNIRQQPPLPVSNNDVGSTLKTAVQQQQPQQISSSSSPLAKYPNLRTLLMPVTSSLLSEVSTQQQQQEDWPAAPSLTSKMTSSIDFACDAVLPSLSTPSSSVSTMPTGTACSAITSPFYSALQSADDGLVRLRRHLAAVQPAQK